MPLTPIEKLMRFPEQYKAELALDEVVRNPTKKNRDEFDRAAEVYQLASSGQLIRDRLVKEWGRK